MKNLLLLCIISAPLCAESISITSDAARGQRSSSGYFFTYQDKVIAHGPQLGTLHTDLLTAHFVGHHTTTCDYVLARNVTLRHKEHILTASRAFFNPRTSRLTVQENVKIMATNVVTAAHTAVLDLNTNQLHLNHGTHTHAFTRTGS